MQGYQDNVQTNFDKTNSDKVKILISLSPND